MLITLRKKFKNIKHSKQSRGQTHATQVLGPEMTRTQPQHPDRQQPVRRRAASLLAGDHQPGLGLQAHLAHELLPAGAEREDPGIRPLRAEDPIARLRRRRHRQRGGQAARARDGDVLPHRNHAAARPRARVGARGVGMGRTRRARR